MPTFCNISVVSQRYKIVASKLMFAANVFSLFINKTPTFTSQGFVMSKRICIFRLLKTK